MTLRGAPGWLLSGGRLPKRPAHDWKSLYPLFWKRWEKVWKCDWWLIMFMWWSLRKILRVRGLESFPVGEHIHILGEQCSVAPLGQKLLCLGPPGPHLMHLLIQQIIYILYQSFNKLVIISKSFPEFCELFYLANDWIQGGGQRFLWIRQGLWVIWGSRTCDWHLKLDSLVGLSP